MPIEESYLAELEKLCDVITEGSPTSPPKALARQTKLLIQLIRAERMTTGGSDALPNEAVDWLRGIKK